MTLSTTVIQLLQGGLGNLAAYLAAHVLLCLLPAFFIAGGLSALVPREAITKYLGPKAPKLVSYPAAALGGFVLAVCSCTIMPIFAGIHKKGAGLGPAITFLFVGPAINILALTYTGVALGMDIAVARVVLAAVFGIGIGLIMAIIYRKDDAARTATDGRSFSRGGGIERRTWVFMLLMLALLIVGTLQVGLLTNSYSRLSLPIAGAEELQSSLDRLVPYDASVGEEGVSVQGLLLIVLLAAIAVSAWRGLSHVDEGYNTWTWIALGLTGITLAIAALRVVPTAAGLDLFITAKFFGVIVVMAGMWWVARRWFEEYELQEWLWEVWRFVKQIFPLLVVGVFAVGVVRGLIRPQWIEYLAGQNTVMANLVGVLFGVFMYFPTLVEVPIAKMFLGLGMHRGPLLAYLMADPELSLQSILITSKVIGKGKAWVYVAWVTLFSTLAGLIYGAWVDGAALLTLMLYLGAGLGLLIAGLAAISRWQSARDARLATVGAAHIRAD